MRKFSRAALALVTATAVATGGASVATAAPTSSAWPYVSPNNGDPLHNSPISENQLPGSARSLYNQGYLDEALVGAGIAAIALVIVGTAAVNNVNLQQGLHGQFIDRLPF